MTTINPYLTFKGNCEEASNFYKSVFGNEFQFVGRFSDMPENKNYPVAESDKAKIMHISLPIGSGTVLFGSDAIGDSENSTVVGNNITNHPPDRVLVNSFSLVCKRSHSTGRSRKLRQRHGIVWQGRTRSHSTGCGYVNPAACDRGS